MVIQAYEQMVIGQRLYNASARRLRPDDFFVVFVSIREARTVAGMRTKLESSLSVCRFNRELCDTSHLREVDGKMLGREISTGGG